MCFLFFHRAILRLTLLSHLPPLLQPPLRRRSAQRRPPLTVSYELLNIFDSDKCRLRKAYMVSGALITGFWGELSLALCRCLEAHFKHTREQI